MIREFKHELIEVSHFQIGIKRPELWNLEVQFLGSILTPLKTRINLDHKNGLKF